MATIKQRGDSYKITVSCGYDLNGKQIRRHLTWTPEPGMTKRQLQKELDRQAVLFEEKCRNGQVLDGNIKFAEFAEKWFVDYAEKQLRPRTVGSYREMLPRINAALGHMRMDRLQPHHIISFYNNMAEIGVREDGRQHCRVDLKVLLRSRSLTQTKFAEQAGISIATLYSINKGNNVSNESAERIARALEMPLTDLFEPTNKDRKLAGNTVLHYHKLLSSILTAAVRWQVIPSNPCERVAPPKVERKEAVYLDEEQAADLLAALDKESMQHQVIVKLLLFTGMRRGELCALRWSDVIVTGSYEGYIIIQHSRSTVSGEGVQEGKTKNGRTRTVSMNEEMFSLLRGFCYRKMRLRDENGIPFPEYIFTKDDGTPIHPDTFSKHLKALFAEIGLPKTYHLHTLRHFFVSTLLHEGVDKNTVADLAGHGDTSFLERTYCHPQMQRKQDAAKRMAECLIPTQSAAQMVS